mgnify:FL=1|jgi:hypothetical protein|tara:strand:- start:783 stop:1154 length:372 start_codon:yes stop_codon:yes gene_type:complete
MATQKDLIQKLINDLDSIKSKLPNGEIKRMERTLEILEKNQNEMKSDIRYIRKTILDPEKGLIVRINKNTDFRYDKEKKIKHYEGKLVEFEGVLTWKKTISRGLWGVYSILLGILIKLLFFGN